MCTFFRPSDMQKTRLTNESEVSCPRNRRISAYVRVVVLGVLRRAVLSFGPKNRLFRRCPRPSGIWQAPYDPGQRCTPPRQCTLVDHLVCELRRRRRLKRVAGGLVIRRLEPRVMEIHGFHAMLHYSLGAHGDYFSMLSREAVCGAACPPPLNHEELAPQPDGARCSCCVNVTASP